jgi:PHD/YefM family antitoxin component YafN of YafNO toxin-antitoxin module
MQSAESLIGYLEISEKSLAARDAKAHFSEVLAGLDEGPVMVNLYNKPRAVIIEVKRFVELLEQAEAYLLMEAAAQAATEPRDTYEEIEATIMRDRAARQAAQESLSR